MLEDFRQSGLKLAVVSNTFIPADAMDRHLAMFGLLDFFPVRVYSSDVGYRKPDPRIYRHALDQLGVPGPGVVRRRFAQDRHRGGAAVRHENGAETALGHDPPHRAADAVVRSLSELPAAIQLLFESRMPAPVASRESLATPTV